MVKIMKLVHSLIVFAALATSAVTSLAQASRSITRAEVKAQLAQLEQAGYSPTGSQMQYPDNIQAAEARVQAKNAVSGFGGVANSTSASGSQRQKQ